MNAIEVENLSRNFNSLRAVDHITFSVAAGEIFGFLGHNGAGKTTTIRMLSGQLLPSSGYARVAGCDVITEQRRLRPLIGVVSEHQNLYERMSGRENLEFAARLYGQDMRRVDEVLEQVGLTERAKDNVRNYSNGMKQRLLIARALLHRPQIIFLDEPTRGLDPVVGREIRRLILDLSHQGVTIFLTTHYMEEADQLSDRIGIIDTGKVIALDTPEGLKRRIDQKEIIRLELTGWHDDLAEKLKSIHGIENLTTHQQGEADLWEVNLHAQNSRAALPRIVESISGNGTRLVNMNVVKPSLEDVFIHLTGKA